MNHFHKLSTFALLALALSAGSACTSAVPSEDNQLSRDGNGVEPIAVGSIQGRVVTLSGMPVVAADVEAGGDAGSTDSQGYFSLTHVAAGTDVDVIVQSERYSSGRIRIALAEHQEQSVLLTVAPAELEILDDAAAGGTVVAPSGVEIIFPANSIVDAAGNPVSGAIEVKTALIDEYHDAAAASACLPEKKGIDQAMYYLRIPSTPDSDVSEDIEEISTPSGDEDSREDSRGEFREEFREEFHEESLERGQASLYDEAEDGDGDEEPTTWGEPCDCPNYNSIATIKSILGSKIDTLTLREGTGSTIDLTYDISAAFTTSGFSPVGDIWEDIDNADQALETNSMVTTQVTTSDYADLETNAYEAYDFFISDEFGNVDPTGQYLAIEVFHNRTTASNAVGNNIDTAFLTLADGTNIYASQVVYSETGDNIDATQGDGFVEEVIGAPDGSYTYMGNGWTIMVMCFGQDEYGWCQHFEEDADDETEIEVSDY